MPNTRQPIQLSFPFVYASLPVSSRVQKSLRYNGSSWSYQELASHLGIDKSTLVRGVRDGLTIDQIIERYRTLTSKHGKRGASRFRSPNAHPVQFGRLAPNS
jgi:hypothetical protein